MNKLTKKYWGRCHIASDQQVRKIIPSKKKKEERVRKIMDHKWIQGPVGPAPRNMDTPTKKVLVFGISHENVEDFFPVY